MASQLGRRLLGIRATICVLFSSAACSDAPKYLRKGLGVPSDSQSESPESTMVETASADQSTDDKSKITKIDSPTSKNAPLSEQVKYVEIPKAGYDGAGQVWLNFKTGELAFRSCANGEPGCTVSALYPIARTAGAAYLWDMKIVYMDDHEEHVGAVHTAEANFLTAPTKPFGTFDQPMGRYLKAPYYNPGGTTLQLPGDWSKNVAGAMTSSCVQPISERRRTALAGNVMSTSWKDHLIGDASHGLKEPENWVGIELDDSTPYEDGIFAQHTTIHLSQDGTTFTPEVPELPALWLLAGGYDAAKGELPCNLEYTLVNP